MDNNYDLKFVDVSLYVAILNALSENAVYVDLECPYGRVVPGLALANNIILLIEEFKPLFVSEES